jgi:hypothetical protein
MGMKFSAKQAVSNRAQQAADSTYKQSSNSEFVLQVSGDCCYHVCEALFVKGKLALGLS